MRAAGTDMSQQLDSALWPAIEFQGKILPQSVSGIHILIYQPLSERALDWIWRLPHCREVWKGGSADWCVSSASELMDHLLDSRDEIISEINERLAPHGMDPVTTYEEWLSALADIRRLAEETEGDCLWIAGQPSQEAEAMRTRTLNFLDRQK